MKHLRIVYLLSLLLSQCIVISSCRREPDAQPDAQLTPQASALLNGVDWKSQYESYGWLLSTGGSQRKSTTCFYRTIAVYQLSRQGVLRSTLFMSPSDFAVGTYKLRSYNGPAKEELCGSKAAFYTKDDDVLTGAFDLLETADNYLTVESYDATAGIVVGSFQATFVPRTVYATSFLQSTDTLRFTQGRFRTKILNLD